MSRSFVANVNLVFFTQVANRALAFIVSIMIARGLGPENRGDYALFIISATLVASLGSFGMGLGTIYFIGKDSYPVRVLLGNSHWLVLVLGALVAAVLAAVGLVLEPRAFVEGRSYWLYAFAVPAMLEFTLVTAVLVGSERFVAFNVAAFSQVLVLAVGTGAVWLAGSLTIFSVLAVWVFSYAAASAVALIAIGFSQLTVGGFLRPDVPILREQVRFGLPGQVGNVLQRLNYRLDQYLVAAFRSRAEVGYYAVAAGVAEAVWWISNAVSLALLPRLTRMDAQRAGEITPVACRNTLLISLIAAIGIAATAPITVKLLFGADFGPAVEPIIWLAPGIAALSGTKVLGSYFFSRERLNLVSVIALITLGVTIVFDLLLIPEFGISGAAIASSIAYTTSLATSLYFYRSLSGNDPLACVIPQAKDMELYRNLARRLRGLRPAPVDSTATPSA